MSIRDEIAAELDGGEYPLQISSVTIERAKLAGVVIVFGYSDDLMEFNGAVDDEIGAYDGTTAYLNAYGLIENECEDEECPYFENMKAKAATIKANWDDGEYSWTYETSIPHVTFDVLDDSEKYCRGIVFNLSDVNP